MISRPQRSLISSLTGVTWGSCASSWSGSGWVPSSRRWTDRGRRQRRGRRSPRSRSGAHEPGDRGRERGPGTHRRTGSGTARRAPADELVCLDEFDRALDNVVEIDQPTTAEHFLVPLDQLRDLRADVLPGVVVGHQPSAAVHRRAEIARVLVRRVDVREGLSETGISLFVGRDEGIGEFGTPGNTCVGSDDTREREAVHRPNEKRRASRDAQCA